MSRYDGTIWRTFTHVDGLAFNWVYSILEDRNGALWFGTNSGVSRYDGTGWRTFTTADGLASNWVNSILEDRNGALWFGTSGGVSRYDGTGWRTFTTADGFASNGVNSILEDRNGALWFATEGGGVSRYDGTIWRTFTTADSLASNWVYSILEDRNGALWFGTSGGVSRYDGTGWRTFTTADGLASNGVNSILEDRNGAWWFGTSGGVSRYDGTGWRTFTTADGLGSNGVTSILEERNGALWFGTNGGVSRYDGTGWRTFTTADGLGSNWVTSILEDRDGALWFGTNGGVSRYDGTIWRTFTTADGLADNVVKSMLEDRNGALWFGTRGDGMTGMGGGVSRYDGTGWRTFTTADGLAFNWVTSILEDRNGALWFGTGGGLRGLGGGVSRYDGMSWRTFTTADGLAFDGVHSILEDRKGALWFGTGWGGGVTGTCCGVSRYDGTIWRTFTTADGLASNFASSILEDRNGALWFGTNGGVSRYDGTIWRTFTTADGLASNEVTSIFEERNGALWFGTTAGGATEYSPDRVSPRTVILNAPDPVWPARIVTFTAVAGFHESRGIEFSARLDGGDWSAWGGVGAWTFLGLADGTHLFEAKSRDADHNVDPFPARWYFEVDATPPLPRVTYPVNSQIVNGIVAVVGTAADARFDSLRLEVQPTGGSGWALVSQDTVPVTEGILGTWNTVPLADGDYQLRLSVSDTLGLSAATIVDVTVDNVAPPARQTSPAKVSAMSGGDVYTVDGGVHISFPPRAFPEDQTVSITRLDSLMMPESWPLGTHPVLPSDSLSWGDQRLMKTAILDLSYAAVPKSLLAGRTLAVYHARGADRPRRLGGTVAPEQERITVAMREPGRYTMCTDSGADPGAAALSVPVVTPRVMRLASSMRSPVAISFSIAKPGPVSVRVYNAAGRLVRRVLDAETLGAGINVVRWDGRDGDGRDVVVGLYLLVVQARGEARTQTMAVTR